MDMMEIDGDTIEVTEDDADGPEIYAEEVGIEFNDESGDGFAPADPKPGGGGPVTIYRLVKLEHAEALGISLREGSVATPDRQTRIITRNIIKLSRPPRGPVQKGGTTDRRFVCRLCDKGFRHASHLRRHVNSHTGERLYDCEVCDKGFLDASTLCRHRRTHTGARPFVCKECQKCFGTLGSLRRHVTVHNQASRPHRCETCDKRFPDASSFRKHRLIHAGARPHACEACGKSFVHVGDLNGHRRVHDGARPWTCDRCGKRFSKQGNCARHSLIHDGGREFACHLCHVGYNFQSSLTRHLLTHRATDKPPRRAKRKVVILTEVDGGDGGRPDDLEPSKLTLRQIKYLVRENKIDFGGDSDDERGDGESAEIVVAVGDGEETNEDGRPPEECATVSVSEEMGEETGTVVVKHVTEDGDVRYVIEEA